MSPDGTATQLDNIGGLFLGSLKNIPYDCGNLVLKKNDLLFFYTDGVTEAEDGQDNEFEDHRLAACLSKFASESPQQITEHVFNEVKTFSQDQPQTDDITCLSIRYLPSSQ